MKRSTGFLAILVFLLGFSACGTTSQGIRDKAESVRSDVFQEISDASQGLPNTSDLIIRAHVKTHLEGYYILESRSSLNGKPGYPFVINIDGQGLLCKVKGLRESTARYDEKGKRIPEGGNGVRYNLDKSIRLSPGTHTVYFGLPEDNFFAEFKITLAEGRKHTLELKPAYRTYVKSSPVFEYGVSKFDIFLDGIPLSGTSKT